MKFRHRAIDFHGDFDATDSLVVGHAPASSMGRGQGGSGMLDAGALIS